MLMLIFQQTAQSFSFLAGSFVQVPVVGLSGINNIVTSLPARKRKNRFSSALFIPALKNVSSKLGVSMRRGSLMAQFFLADRTIRDRLSLPACKVM